MNKNKKNIPGLETRVSSLSSAAGALVDADVSCRCCCGCGVTGVSFGGRLSSGCLVVVSWWSRHEHGGGRQASTCDVEVW